MSSIWKSFLPLLLLIPHLGLAQSVSFPAHGIYNGFLNQVNVVECENTHSSSVTLTIKLRRDDGSIKAQKNISLPAFGGKHLVLNSISSITNAYGSYTLELPTGSTLGAHISCRTAFYRYAPAQSGRTLEYAYTLPVRNPQSGVLRGIYNSFNPSAAPLPVSNWLSIVNLSTSPFHATIRVYSKTGSLLRTLALRNLAPRGRRDVALGHPSGQQTGTYVITPQNLSQSYDAFLLRYGQRDPSHYLFAFPLRGQSGSCNNTQTLLSTMATGTTNNWLELANGGQTPITLGITIKDRNGNNIHQEQRTLAAYSLDHLHVNPFLDPQAKGKVGSVTFSCQNSDLPLLVTSVYYGRLRGLQAVSWSYATQSQMLVQGDNTSQFVAPVNTYLGMANWLKMLNATSGTPTLTSTILTQGGTAIDKRNYTLARYGTADINLHAIAGQNFIGSSLSTLNANSVSGELLRVLTRSDGQIETIMHIPLSVQHKTTPPTPASGYFPSGAVWYQDVSNAALDPQSSQVINWLENAGGWGSGQMRIDFSIEVLQATGATPFRSFTRTDDFYEPDCDHLSMPVPAGGALEGEEGYECISDGDCHLIVVHPPSKRLFEMWRANIVGGTFYGGCLAVWDMNRVYTPRGRGQDCTSADASGFPIAPLLFSADEVARGNINHAIRFILPNARIRHRTYVHPGTHATGAASGGSSAPPYGAHFRLRNNFPLHTLPNEGARVVARALQRYGMFLSDGGTIALTAQSDRFTQAKWESLLGPRDLTLLRVSDFEMINGGSRFTFTGDCIREP